MMPPNDNFRPVLWASTYPLVLASGSKARSQILTAVGLNHAVCPADIDERSLEVENAGVSASDVALTLSRAKALAGSSLRPDAIVIGADQTLECEGVAFHKAANPSEARQQLRGLRGKKHWLNSAFTVCKYGIVEVSKVAKAALTMRDFSDEFLDLYIQMAGPALMSSVGCYQIEGLGAHLFDRIEGDQFVIMGLPIFDLLEYFRTAGYITE